MTTKSKKPYNRLASLRKISKHRLFTKTYIIASLTILLATTCYWALLSAQIQAGNADQLANTYLFEHSDTFGAATLPGQHTFLLKWPLFLLIKLFGSTSLAFTVATVAVTLLTVGALAYIIYRIERRPLVFGTLWLALASVMLLIPTQPYFGSLLPVNMAMVTTRNLEYIVFIVSLIIMMYPRIRQGWRFTAASLLMTLLIASDKLFLAISVGGALLAIVFYMLARKWVLVKLSAMWLAVSIAGGILAAGIVQFLTTSGFTSIAVSAASGPYNFVRSSKELLLGSIHAVLSVFTNLGANPATDTRLLNTVPRQIITSLVHPQGIGFIVNTVIALTGLVAIVSLVSMSARRSGRKKRRHLKKPDTPDDQALGLSMMLIFSTIAACGVFAVTSHYYPVDARYVGIVLFTAFIALATFMRAHHVARPELVILAGIVILVSISIGLVTARNNYDSAKTASAEIDKRNGIIVEAMKHHPVDTLVGDYWRVFPTKLRAKAPLAVTPLAGCTQNRDVLSSQVWQPDLRQHSFAYLLTLDKNLTDDYSPCSLDQITKEYGLPNASVMVAGDFQHPKELLLFYDKGINKKALKTKPNTPQSSVPATVAPIAIENIPYADCTDLTTMNIVAHQDDDLLFMNPDLIHDIKAGRCIRTVYVTAGDAGIDKYYWLGREAGSEAAYNTMVGLAADTVWVQRIVKLPGGQFITIANPQRNAKISLIFMHLPDGNVGGQGFNLSNHESLARLEHGQVSTLHALDQQSIYTSDALVNALATLIGTYHPNDIHTQANMIDRRYPADHSDHMAVGRFVKRAYHQYTTNQGDAVSQLVFYIGYPIYGMPVNVWGDDLAKKQHIFFDYAQHDNGACHSIEQCSHGSAYSNYLKRQYKNSF